MRWSVDNRQIVSGQTKAKSCGVCPRTFKMSGSSAIWPLIELTVVFFCLTMRHSTSQNHSLPLNLRFFILGSILIEDSCSKTCNILFLSSPKPLPFCKQKNLLNEAYTDLIPEPIRYMLRQWVQISPAHFDLTFLVINKAEQMRKRKKRMSLTQSSNSLS